MITRLLFITALFLSLPLLSTAQCPLHEEVEISVVDVDDEEGTIILSLGNYDASEFQYEVFDFWKGLIDDSETEIEDNIAEFEELDHSEYIIRIIGRDGCDIYVGLDENFYGIIIGDKPPGLE